MAAQVQRPKKKQDDLGPLLTVGGAIAGGVIGAKTGGPAGALKGASMGGQLGSTAGSLLSFMDGGGGGGEPQGAMAAAGRRMGPASTLPEVVDPQQAVQEAQVALVNLPQEQQAQFAPALQMGSAAMRRQKGYA